MTILRGILCALVTPFGDDGRLSEDVLRELTERMISDGIHGLVPCGSTGEFFALTDEERRRVNEIVVAQAGGRVPVVPQIGAMTTAAAIEHAMHAESIGADAILVVQPWYNRLSETATFGYYRDVAAAVSLPVVAYNFPGGTGVNLTPAFLSRMAREIENFRYVKDTSSDLAQVSELVYGHGDEIGTFIGDDRLIFPGLALGCIGSIWGASNLMPKQTASLFELCAAGDFESANTLWDQLYPVQEFLWSGEGYVTSVKAGTEMYGVPVGDPRLPFPPLSGDGRARLRELMEDAGVFDAAST